MTLVMRTWVMAHTTEDGRKVQGHWQVMDAPITPLKGVKHTVETCPAQGLCFQCGAPIVWRLFKAGVWQELALWTDPRTREPHQCGEQGCERKEGGDTTM